MEALDRVLEERSHTRPWYRGGSLIAAVVLHVIVFAAAIVAPSLFAERPQPQEFVSIQIVPAAALGQIQVPPPPPPAPEPAAPPAPTAPEPEPEPREAPAPAPERERERPPAPVPAVPADTAPRPAAPSDQQLELTDPSSTAAPGRLGSPQGDPLATGGPAEISGFDDPNFTYSYYAELMLARIRAKWQRPPLGGEIELVVYFRISEDGRVSDLEILQSSGYNSFDRSGLRAVQTATLPPLPKSYRRGSLGVRLIIR